VGGGALVTPADLRLYGWLLALPSSPASIVAELAGTAEERTLQRVCEDLRTLVADGKAAPECGGFVWAETRIPALDLLTRISDLLRVEPLRLWQIMRVLSASAADVKSALVHGPFRERSQRWHVVGPA